MKASEKSPKSLLVKILQWFYLLLALVSVGVIFVFPQITSLSAIGIPIEIIVGVFIAFAFYCLILSGSFFFQSTNLLILSLVLIFFTSLGGLVLLAIALPNAQHVINGDLPSCVRNLAACDLKEGIIVASAGLLAVSVPLLFINIVTIVGALKAIATTD